METKYQKIDTLIKAGEITSAQTELTKLVSKPVSRGNAVHVAEFARRLNLPLISLRILSKYVRSTTKVHYEAEPSEKLEYAGALLQIGAFFECEVLLAELRKSPIKKSLLLESFVCFSRWQYREAIPLLENYVASDISEYEKIIGKINLGACFVDQRKSTEAEATLLSLVIETERRSLWRLQASVFTLLAENAVHQKKYPLAKEYLTKAEKILGKGEAWDRVHMEKWKLIAQHSDLTRPILRKRLEELSQSAVKIGDWETVREVDRYIAKYCHDEKLFLKLFFGTPYESYRKRLIHECGDQKQNSRSYLWGAENNPTQRILNLNAAELEGAKEPLVRNGVIHRLLQVLLTDFYLPKGIGTIHSHLYPGEYFNPISSPGKVRRVFARAREWFKNEKLGLSIIEAGQGFKLESKGLIAVQLTLNDARRNPELRALYEIHQEKFFTAKEAGAELNIPARTMKRYLAELVELGGLRRTGAKSMTRYQIIKKK